MDVKPSARPTMDAYRRGASNLTALTCIQLGNALLPLVAYPLILSVVGTEPFAKVAVTESIVMMILAVVIFSFDIDGVSRIAALRVESDIQEISVVFSEVLFARVAIFGASVLLVLAAASVVDRTTLWLLLGWLLYPLGYVLQSAWFFQAVERNAVPAAVVVSSRVACLVLLHLFVVAPADFYLAPVIIGSTYAVGGAVLLGYAVTEHRVRLTPVSARRIGELLVGGKDVFIGNIAVALYRDSNVLILSIFSSSAAVSLYAIAEKIVKVFQAGARPLNQLFFPKAVRALQDITTPGRAAFVAVWRYTVVQLGLLGVGVTGLLIGLLVFRSVLPAGLTAGNALEVGQLIAIMAVAVFFGVMNYMFGSVGLNYLDRRRYLARSIVITGCCSVALCVALAQVMGATGAAVSFVVAEMLLFGQIMRAYA